MINEKDNQGEVKETQTLVPMSEPVGEVDTDEVLIEAKKEEDDSPEIRAAWSSKIEFFLSCLSFAVGLGNVWRFPYLCYKNGGGAFLIPYVLNLIFTGLPLFFFELSLGQYASSSPIALWSIVPLFQGIGFSMLVIVIGIGLYYNVIIAWILYYLAAVLYSIPSGQLPWTTCGNSWNSPGCVEINHVNSSNPRQNTTNTTTPPEDYFNRNMLQISSGIEDIGGVRWELAGCLVVAWLIVFSALIKGVKSLGKAVWFTALFPYLILSILLLFGLSLDGAIDGIKYYVTPNMSRLGDIQVWADAAMQIFFSLGPCWGSLITLASYNKFNNNTLRDAVFVASANCLTSFFAGFVVFSFIGFMAHSVNKDIEDVIVTGPGLAFVVYPEAVSKLPLPHVWALLFFIMLLFLGLGTQFSIMETITRIVVDAWPGHLSHRVVLVIACTLMCLGGISMTTNGGMYVLQMMDNHAGTFSALLTGLIEVLVVSWVYGVDRFLEDIRRMVGWTGHGMLYRAHRTYWAVTWKFVTPGLLTVILVASALDYKPMKYGDAVYPDWANGLGWLVSMASVACIPLVMLWKVAMQGRWKIISKDDRWDELIRPSPEWGKAERDFLKNTENTDLHLESSLIL